MAAAPSVCRTCGEHLVWVDRRKFDFDGKPHSCKPKIKVYTEEEKKRFQEEREGK